MRVDENLAELPPPVTAHLPLADALHILIAAPGTGLPVLDDTRATLVGWITHQTVLSTLHPVASGRDLS